MTDTSRDRMFILDGGVTYRPDGDQYLVLLHGEQIGIVYKSRTKTDRFPWDDGRAWRRGRTRWFIDTITDEDYPTRREAVRDLLSRRVPHA